MKKIVTFLLVCSAIIAPGFAALPYQPSPQDIVTVMHDIGVTRFDTVSDFLFDQAIRRDEMAAMMIRFADVMERKGSPINNMSCNFSDLYQAHDDLTDEVKTACEYGMFQGHQGRFMPTNNITKAQVFAIIGRMMYGKLDEPEGERWSFYRGHLDAGQYIDSSYYIDSDSDPYVYDTTVATRGEIALILYNIYIRNTAQESYTVGIQYTGRLTGGVATIEADDITQNCTSYEVFDTSYEDIAHACDTYIDERDYNQSLVFTIGEEQIIPGLEQGIVGMKIGDNKTIVISSQDAYGLWDEENIIEVPLDQLPLKTGEVLTYAAGDEIITTFGSVTVVSVDDDMVSIDTNHPLAGKDLIFDVYFEEILDWGDIATKNQWYEDSYLEAQAANEYLTQTLSITDNVEMLYDQYYEYAYNVGDDIDLIESERQYFANAIQDSIYSLQSMPSYEGDITLTQGALQYMIDILEVIQGEEKEMLELIQEFFSLSENEQETMKDKYGDRADAIYTAIRDKRETSREQFDEIVKTFSREHSITTFSNW